MDITEGVHRGRATGTPAPLGWTPITSYDSYSGYGAFSLGSGFDKATGIYTAQESGIFYANAFARLDGLVPGSTHMNVAINEQMNAENGLSRYMHVSSSTSCASQPQNHSQYPRVLSPKLSLILHL